MTKLEERLSSITLLDLESVIGGDNCNNTCGPGDAQEWVLKHGAPSWWPAAQLTPAPAAPPTPKPAH
jgi:hypothetical protein